jgi:hypothetical protein
MLNFKDWLTKENADAAATDLTSILKGTTVTLLGKDPKTAKASDVANKVMQNKDVKKASDASLDPIAVDGKKLVGFVQNQIKNAIDQQQRDSQKAMVAKP